MLRKLIGTISILLFIVASTADGQQLKIGFMNPQQVLSQLPESAEVEQKLNDLIEEKRTEFQQRTADFQEELADYQQNSTSMSEEQQRKREEELASKEEELIEYQQSIQQEIRQREAELMAPLYNRMNQAISEVAEQMNLDFVLNEATGMGDSIIFYASSEQLNITQQVLERMNSQ